MTTSRPRRHGAGGRRRWWALLAVAACLLTAFSSTASYGAATTSAPSQASGALTSRGHWTVEPFGPGVRVTWRAATPVPVTDSRPEFRLGTRLLGYPRLGADRRTLTLDLPGSARPDPARLQVWLGLRRLDVAGPSLPTGPQVPTTPQRRLRSTALAPPADPGTPGDHAVESFDYSAPPLPWKPESLYPEPMEVLGHAVLPVGVSHAPLVLFLHGRHWACYGEGDTGAWPCAGGSQPVPSYLGYRYLQRLLATQGYASVSISANAINAQDFAASDGGARARALLVLHHLSLLAQWNADPTEPRWFGRLDLNRVVLVGHSRGGEGVDQAAIDRPAGAPYRIVGQVLIAPTDFGYQTASYLPTEVLLPYCDGDVSDLQGQRYVDTAPLLAPSDPSLRASVLLMGADHNFFNTEWTPGIAQAPASDDWWDPSDPVCGRQASDTRLSPREQRRAAKTFVAAGVHAFLGDTSATAWLDSGRPVAVPQAGPAVALTEALGGDRRTVRLGAGARLAGAATACRGGQATRAAATSLCGSPEFAREPHWAPGDTSFAWTTSAYFRSGLPREAQLAWSTAGARGGFTLDQPLDLAAAGAALDLRVVVDPATGPVGVRVVLGSGDRSWAGPEQVLSPLPGTPWLSALWGPTLRVDPTDYAGHLDLAAVDRVQLQATTASGRLWILDASRRLDGLLPVPARRLPRVRLGGVRLPEGSAADGGVAQVPYRILGHLTAPATFAVAEEQGTFGERARPVFTTVTVQPGQTAGTIPLRYEADDLDDLPWQAQTVWAVPRSGILTSWYAGTAIVLDDDPTPTVGFTAVPPSVHYGDNLVFRVRLSAPVDYWPANLVSAVPVPGRPPLRTSDVPRRWVEAQMGDVPADVPLAQVWHDGWVDLRPGQTVGTLVIPTLRHPLHARTKWLGLRFTSGPLHARVRATARIAVP